MAKMIIGVMGPGEGATVKDIEMATTLGKLIAQKGWVLLTGGQNVGVMEGALKGAANAGGLTIGILPTEDDSNASSFIDIPVRTGMGSARNNINVLSSDVVIACGIGLGTSSEIMLALKAGKPVILLNQSKEVLSFIKEIANSAVYIADNPEQAILLITEII